MAKVITFGSLKGGVGKTVASTNVATELALRGYKVLFIDLDPQATSTGYFGIEPMPAEGTKRLITVGELLYSPHKRYTLDDVVVKHEEIENLWVTPTHYAALDSAESNLDGFARMNAVKKHIVKAAEVSEQLANLDFIVIDTRPSLGVLTDNALVAADYAVPVCTMFASAAEGAGSFATRIHTLQEDSEAPLSVRTTPWLLADWSSTRAGEEAKGLLKTLTHQENPDEAEKFAQLSEEEQEAYVRDFIEAEAPEEVKAKQYFRSKLPHSLDSSKLPGYYGVPAVAVKPNIPFSKAVQAFTDELLEYIEATQN